MKGTVKLLAIIVLSVTCFPFLPGDVHALTLYDWKPADIGNSHGISGGIASVHSLDHFFPTPSGVMNLTISGTLPYSNNNYTHNIGGEVSHYSHGIIQNIDEYFVPDNFYNDWSIVSSVDFYGEIHALTNYFQIWVSPWSDPFMTQIMVAYDQYIEIDSEWLALNETQYTYHYGNFEKIGHAPEPSTFILLSLGLACGVLYRYRKSAKSGGCN